MKPDGYKRFQELLKQGHYTNMMGFKGGAATVNQFANRVRVARAFRGIDLEGYSPKTVSGYNALFQVFLTHSALELFMEISRIRKGDLDALGSLLEPYGSHKVVEEFRERDPERRFYSFVHDKVNDRLKIRLEACMNGESANLAHLSAAIRHIFVHGYLTAHANRATPSQVDFLCGTISDFLLDFMNHEFTRKVDVYYDKVHAEE